MAKVINQLHRGKPKFDTSKPYRWEETDIFEITGKQFAQLYHALSQEINNTGGAPIGLKYQAYQVIMEILQGGVEQGVITENTELGASIDESTNEKVKELFNQQKQ